MEIHQDQIVWYEGVTGLSDIGLLESAINMSSATNRSTFLHTDVY